MNGNSNHQKDIQALEKRLADLNHERHQVEGALLLLKKRLLVSKHETQATPSVIEHEGMTLEEKVALFESLFVGRNDVFALRFENINNPAIRGYKPCCLNEFKPGLCLKKKQRIPCSRCPNRELAPLTQEVLRWHLSGINDKGKPFTIGTYALMPGDVCRFLAIDFDKGTYQTDAVAFLETCDQYEVPAYLERSRSGNGAHVWIFFAETISAHIARQMGAFLLTKTIEKTPHLLLDSYDRLFPNQDTVPDGGFGNLIALPLQKIPRRAGNSVFVNRHFEVIPHQWTYLSLVKRMSKDEVLRLARRVQEVDGINDESIPMITLEESPNPDAPWDVVPDTPLERLKASLPQNPVPVEIVLANLIYFRKSQLPPNLLSYLMRMATFQNPEFYKKQKQRLSAHGTPRLIHTFVDDPRYPKFIGLPRGLKDEILGLLDELNYSYQVIDKRTAGESIGVRFVGELRSEQKVAFRKLSQYEHGVLSASTAFGKTVLGIALLAKRNVPTLILVHRTQLAQQWKERLQTFLDIDEKKIGQIGAGKRKPTGIIDIALFQSLKDDEKTKALLKPYGMVIVDECHHVAAVNFEKVLRLSSARYTLGLSATVTRSDGHHPIIYMQLGPCRHRTLVKNDVKRHPFAHHLIVRETAVTLPPELAGQEKPPMADIYRYLANFDVRNQQIAQDIRAALAAKRSPVVITARKFHLDVLRDLLTDVPNVFVLQGGMNKKKQQAVLDDFFAVKETEPRLLLATGSFLGEGFDDPRLDTLFLVLPVSGSNVLTQYLGRLHRIHDQKREVQVYDYRDLKITVTERMFQKRQKRYLSIGYVEKEEGESGELAFE